MTWFKVDDQLAFNMKVLSAGNAAMGLWVRAGSWSAAQLSDGVVPEAIVAALGGSASDAAALVSAGLWHPIDGGWEFHDWAEYQPDAASTKAKRRAESEGGQRGNHTRWHERRGVIVEGCEFCTGSGTRSANDREGDRVPDNVPDRVGDRVSIGLPESPPNPPVPGPDPTPSFSNEKEDSSSAIADATARPDVDALLELLDEGIVANGGKAPARNRKNRDAMRLLLDKDGRTVDQVAAAIRWCQADEFWRANILSASKLREKYDQLRLAAARRPGGANRAQERQASNLAVVSRLAALDAADGVARRAVGA